MVVMPAVIFHSNMGVLLTINALEIILMHGVQQKWMNLETIMDIIIVVMEIARFLMIMKMVNFSNR